MIKNKQGIERDIYCSIEHFGDKQKALEYVLNEFKNEYSETDIRETFQAVSSKYFK